MGKPISGTVASDNIYSAVLVIGGSFSQAQLERNVEVRTLSRPASERLKRTTIDIPKHSTRKWKNVFFRRRGVIVDGERPTGTEKLLWRRTSETRHLFQCF